MRVEHTLSIDAPPEVVWAVTQDVERWPEWSPTMTSVQRGEEGPLRPGSVTYIKQPLQPMARWVVTGLVNGRRFAWETHRPGLHMAAFHEVLPEGRASRNRLVVEATGPLATALAPLLRLVMGRALAEENRGLKAHCEALSAPGESG